MNLFFNIIVSVPPLLIAVILHEIAHGYVAKKLGDPTASDAGRLTLNPIKHIDLFWTILLPAMLIVCGSPVVLGGAKPVPVDPRYFRRPRKDMMWVALAGPLTNFILAGISLVLFKLFLVLVLKNDPTPLMEQTLSNGILVLSLYIIAGWLQASVLINVILGMFNLIPFPPLDGGRIAVGLLPWELARRWMRLERWGIVIVFVLLYFNIIDWFLRPIYGWVVNFMYSM